MGGSHNSFLYVTHRHLLIFSDRSCRVANHPTGPKLKVSIHCREVIYFLIKNFFSFSTTSRFFPRKGNFQDPDAMMLSMVVCASTTDREVIY
jgi:hypothetical protein